MKTRPSRIPVEALKRVLAMAEEMAGSTGFQVPVDYDPRSATVVTKTLDEVQRDLDAVREWLGGMGKRR